MGEIKGLGLRWLCPACGRVIDKPPTAVKDPSTRKVRRYHSSHCQTPLVRCTVELGEKVDAEVIRLRDAVRAWCADDDSHTEACALWLPYPTGTEPACDCPVRELRKVLS